MTTNTWAAMSNEQASEARSLPTPTPGPSALAVLASVDLGIPLELVAVRVPPALAVEVRNRFDGRWSAGFEVVRDTPGPGGTPYRLRRRSDGRILPGWFGAGEVRLILA